MLRMADDGRGRERSLADVVMRAEGNISLESLRL